MTTMRIYQGFCIWQNKVIRTVFSLLSADGNRQVTPLCPPADCEPGDRVEIQGYEHKIAGGMDISFVNRNKQKPSN